MGLFFIWNKEFRQDERLVRTLSSKITDAENISVRHEGNTEIYKLDVLEIHFHLSTPNEMKIVAGDETIYTMNCEYDINNELQQHRAHLFYIARNRFQKQQEKAARKSELAKSAAKVQADKEKKKSAEQARLLQIQNAIDRIR